MDAFEDVDDFFGNFPRRTISKSFAPAVNISQTETDVVAEVPLPGVNPEKVEITIENDVLTIHGKEEKTSEVEEQNYTRREWVSQSFYRSVALPVSVKSDAAEAEYENGILRITIPKREEAKAKKVSIKIKK